MNCQHYTADLPYPSLTAHLKLAHLNLFSSVVGTGLKNQTGHLNAFRQTHIVLGASAANTHSPHGFCQK